MSSPQVIAARLMSDFAARSGLFPAVSDKRRYLWTDAFAVCNFLTLFERTGEVEYRQRAIELVDHVHRVLGRYRDDDQRRGWISGADEVAGRDHPTAGGLRIGKPLRERGAAEPFDERLEWDRDGQYFHYLTKWMHALCQTAFATGEAAHARWAAELAQTAFEKSLRRTATGEIVGVFWKMSTDLSRPLVPASGQHDALDGLITFREVQRAHRHLPDRNGVPDLGPAIGTLSTLCRHRDWTTDDPLGLGGLLFDACRLCRLPDDGTTDDASLMEEIASACCRGLSAWLANGGLNQPVAYRLAFRELGLAIGLCGVPIIDEALGNGAKGSGTHAGLRRAVDRLLSFQTLGQTIVDDWMQGSRQREPGWRAHQDINDVMLATALLPDRFLSIGGL
jgi:hypothetical protein